MQYPSSSSVQAPTSPPRLIDIADDFPPYVIVHIHGVLRCEQNVGCFPSQTKPFGGTSFPRNRGLSVSKNPVTEILVRLENRIACRQCGSESVVTRTKSLTSRSLQHWAKAEHRLRASAHSKFMAVRQKYLGPSKSMLCVGRDPRFSVSEAHVFSTSRKHYVKRLAESARVYTANSKNGSKQSGYLMRVFGQCASASNDEA